MEPFSAPDSRRGSFNIDPLAFDSTPSLIASPGGTNTDLSSNSMFSGIKFKKSAEILKDIGKKVLPRSLRPKHRTSTPLVQQIEDVERNMAIQRRHRSDTLESTSSAISIVSRPSISGKAQSEIDYLGSSPSLPPTLAPSALISAQPSPSRSRKGTLINDVAPSPLASPSLSCPSTFDGPPMMKRQSASPLIETADRNLTEILEQMRLEDNAFEATEESMISSGWSSESEINELRKRRFDLRNSWEQRLQEKLKQLEEDKVC